MRLVTKYIASNLYPIIRYKFINSNTPFLNNSDFSIKIYDKGKESKLIEKNLLRIELKITKKRFLNNIGINSLDQIDNDTVSKLFKAFIDRFDKLLIVDSISSWRALETHEMVFYENYTNPNYWNMLRAIKNPQQIRKYKKRILSFIGKIGYDSIKTKILKLLYNKYFSLSDSLSS